MLRIESRLLAACRVAGLLMMAALAGVSPLAAQNAPSQRGSLAHAKSWGYQLQGIDVAKLKASPYDVLVIDYSKDGSDEKALSAEEVESLKVKPDGTRRHVLAYFSVGEAEDYRYYWKWYWGGTWFTDLFGWILAPSWRGPVNTEWRGNYAVRYWQDNWQRLMLGDGPDASKTDSYLGRILRAGFDGVYLDKIDSSVEPIAKGRASALDDMRAFVRRIGERGRAVNPAFLVVPQNGEELLTDAAYRESIDALGKEDLLYGEFSEKKANPPDVVAKRVELLKLLTKDGKPVFAVEYLDDPEQIAAARKTLTDDGFVPHFANRSLNRLRIGDVPRDSKKSQ
jgi:cysteinyl-tRNA synthetase